MPEFVDPESGEVHDAPLGLVPLNLGALSEAELVAILPTPQQAHAALEKARAVNARVPEGMHRYRAALRAAERDLSLAVAVEVKRLRSEEPKAVLAELRQLAHAAERVQAAVDKRDTAWLMYEYARDWKDAIAEDVGLLRSINANLRQEVRS